jgi:hypothetical protein
MVSELVLGFFRALIFSVLVSECSQPSLDTDVTLFPRAAPLP